MHASSLRIVWLGMMLTAFSLSACGKLGEDMVTVEEVKADPDFLAAIVNVEKLHLGFVEYSEAVYPDNPATGVCESNQGELGCQCNADNTCTEDIYECTANANAAMFCKTRSANGMIRAFNRLAKWDSFLFNYLSLLQDFENAKPTEQSDSSHEWDLHGLTDANSRYEPKLVIDRSSSGAYEWQETLSVRVYDGKDYSDEEFTLFTILFNKTDDADDGIGSGVIRFDFNDIQVADPYTDAEGDLTITFDMNKAEGTKTCTEIVLAMNNFTFEEEGDVYEDVTEIYKVYHNTGYDETDLDSHEYTDGSYRYEHQEAFFPAGAPDSEQENFDNFVQWSFFTDHGQVISEVRSGDLTGAYIDHVWKKECWGIDETYGGQGLFYRVNEKYMEDEITGVLSSTPEKDQEIGDIMDCMDGTFSASPF